MMNFRPMPSAYLPDRPFRLADVWLPIAMLGIMWLIHFAQWWGDFSLGVYGLSPKMASGLIGIITAPLLHSDWGHLVANSVPLLVAGSIIFYFYPSVAYRAFAMIYVLTGVVVWSFAKKYTTIIGASGIVYGLVAFIAWLGIFRRSVKAIILALLVVVLYGGMLAGIAPNPDRPNVSWESHFIGGLVGIFAAFYYKDLIEDDEINPVQQPVTPQKLFLPRDIFEKTLAQRAQEREEYLAQLNAIQQEQAALRQRMFHQPPPSGYTSDHT